MGFFLTPLQATICAGAFLVLTMFLVIGDMGRK